VLDEKQNDLCVDEADDEGEVDEVLVDEEEEVFREEVGDHK